MPLGALSAFSALRKLGPPDWYFLLSGSDYPVRRPKEIIADLSNTDFDAFQDGREILYRALPPGQTAQSGFGRADWIPIGYGRYCSTRFWLPSISFKALFSGARPFRKNFLSTPKLDRWLLPNRPPKIFGGEFWFHANHKAISRLLDDPSLPQLVRYYTRRPIPEESFMHTALRNHPDLRICSDHRRYEDWSGQVHHPKWLEISDVPKMLASGAHFARKFRPDGIAQDFIDKEILGISTC